MEQKITVLHAYKAMLIFLEDFYHRTGEPENMKSFLGELQIIRGNITADPAAWYDWLEVVNRIIEDERTK